jgi:hypothetical protein
MGCGEEDGIGVALQASNSWCGCEWVRSGWMKWVYAHIPSACLVFLCVVAMLATHRALSIPPSFLVSRPRLQSECAVCGLAVECGAQIVDVDKGRSLTFE